MIPRLMIIVQEWYFNGTVWSKKVLPGLQCHLHARHQSKQHSIGFQPLGQAGVSGILYPACPSVGFGSCPSSTPTRLTARPGGASRRAKGAMREGLPARNFADGLVSFANVCHLVGHDSQLQARGLRHTACPCPASGPRLNRPENFTRSDVPSCSGKGIGGPTCAVRPVGGPPREEQRIQDVLRILSNKKGGACVGKHRSSVLVGVHFAQVARQVVHSLQARWALRAATRMVRKSQRACVQQHETAHCTANTQHMW
jgi:hypothetical protein